MQKLHLQDLSVKGKKVLMRVDFNVPQNPDGSIADLTRIREALPSIQYILEKGGSVILMSHLGRPKGKRDPKFSLRVCAEALSQLLKKPVQFAPDCIGSEVEKIVSGLKSGEVLLLENLRFYAAEEDPSLDPNFAEALSHLGDIYVNDAFGAAHRAHSSTVMIASYFPHRAAAGLLMQKELSFLGALLKNPKRPFYAIIGGAKISSKIGVLHSLLSKVDGLFIGGGMCYTFLKAMNVPIGDSICEEGAVETAKSFLQAASARELKLWFPEDLVIADGFKNDAKSRIISFKEGISNGWQGMDIGPQTLSSWQAALKAAGTIFWNGPVGVFEFSNFAKGTEGLTRALAHFTAIRIVGGGDSVAAVNGLNLEKYFSHLSTGGGASLEFIEFGRLPGIDALSDK
ncbi:MAG: phosphoglycerate kinase [Anaerolineae bacterium]